MTRLRALLRRDGGFSLVELAVGSMLATLLLTVVALLLVQSFNTSGFTQGQTSTINDARNAFQRIEKELRGADSIAWCTPTGACLEVGAQTPDGAFRTVRYTHASGELRREIFDAGTSTWGAPETIIQRVVNTGGQPVFACETATTLLRVTVDLHIEPTPRSDPNYNLHTSFRPRNFPSIATCP